MEIWEFAERVMCSTGQCVTCLLEPESELSVLKFGSKAISPFVLLIPSLSFPTMPHSPSNVFNGVIYLL